MNEYNWAMLGCLLILIVISLMGLSTARAQRAQLKRSALPVFIGQFVGWCLFGFCFGSGVILVAYLASITVALLPPIVWMLRLPKDGPLN